MNERNIEEQIGSIMSSPDNTHLYYTPEFNDVLLKLKNGEPIDVDCVNLFMDNDHLLLNIGIFRKFIAVILPHLNDEAKKTIASRLHKVFFTDIPPDCKNDICWIMLAIVESIKDTDLRTQAFALASQALAEDPCNPDLRAKVEQLMRQEIPDFKF
ncbi:MAG: hypothetical protein WC604_04285 [Candidatus Gracilibacteria bacterium]